MQSISKLIGPVIITLAVVTVAGCGAAGSNLNSDLKATGLAYHNFHDANRQGPSGWDEFITFASGNAETAGSIRRVKDAGYQMKWSVKFSDVTDGLSNTVLAERPSGGPKLMLDGAVQ